MTGSAAGPEPMHADDGGAGAPRRGPGPRSRARRYTAPLAALIGAGCLAGSAAVPWWVRDYRDPLTGPVRIALGGSQLVPALAPLALVIVAGLGAALLTRGVPRRIIGAAVAVAGLAAAALAASAVAAPAAARFTGQLTRPAAAVAGAVRNIGGPLLGVLGGALVVFAGITVMLARNPVANRVSGYESPAARRDRARAIASTESGRGRATADRAGGDGGQWWRALDAGIDPTSDEGAGGGGPGSPDDPTATPADRGA